MPETKNILNKFKLNNDCAVITGGAGFLGIQHGEALIEAGCSIILLDINDDALLQAKKHFIKKYNKEIMTYRCDITDESEIISTQEQIKAKGMEPSILINNAAIDAKPEHGSIINNLRLENFDISNWTKEINTGLTGAFLCCKHFGNSMANRNKGVILNISSDLGLIAPNQNLYKKSNLDYEKQDVKPVTYSVIKHGLIGLTKYMATYWADKGVRCNALAPGGVDNQYSAEFLEKIGNLIPMGRMANIDEYKASVVYMCSDASSYMNGATISIDGGRTAW